MFYSGIGGVYLMMHIHLIGIGGTGISSIARVLLEKGFVVTGSDRTLSPLALDLEIHGAKVYEGHSPKNILGANLVVRSSAIPDSNVEVIAARAAGIPVLKRSDFLASLMQDQIGIAVAGSHGKTTTTAMMAYSLNRLGLDPSYIIGGVSKDLAGNAHAGKGKYFVIEADEYDRMFLGLKPQVIIVTNVEYDHPDCYPTPADYRQVFGEFVHRLKPSGQLVTSADDSGAASLTNSLPTGVNAFTYGLSENANYQAINLKVNALGGFDFDVSYQEKAKKITLAHVSLKIPGEHNVRNALAVLSTLHAMGLSIDQAGRNLSGFSGTGRRFDVVGEIDGITIVDDYAHHPAKIHATLSAARSRYPGRRLVAVWQPHTYSRTRALANDFIQSLQEADVTVVTEIYAAREPLEAFSSAELVEKMTGKEAFYCKTLDETVHFLESKLVTGDVLLVLSAGDADQVCTRVLQSLKERKG